MERKSGPLNGLTIRLLLFNILLIFIPAVALILLDTYEKQLLVQQEKAMVQQGRMFSAALVTGDLTEGAERLFYNLRGRLEARIRITDAEGHLLADSAVFGKSIPEPEPKAPPYHSDRLLPRPPQEIQKTVLYRMAVTPIRLFRKYILPPPAPYGSGDFYSRKDILSGPEISAALEGRYGAITRISTGGQKSVNLYSAIPIFDPEGTVRGVVLVNQSTYKILVNLYRIRLDIIRIFLYYLLGSAAFSLILARTIAAPLKRLRNQAEEVLDSHGTPLGTIKPLGRDDEIGDLSRALNRMTMRLEERLRFTEDFFSDILHEVKNPLTAIRSSAELAETATSSTDSERFLKIIQRETEKLEKLLSSIREISRIHTGLLQEGEETFDPASLLADLVDAFQCRSGSRIHYQYSGEEGVVLFKGNRDRLAQVISNLLENAQSFTPDGGIVSARLEPVPEGLVLSVADTGPGIPLEDQEKIFNRFYSTRGQKDGHQGLGLSIVKSIIEGYGGTITSRNNPEGGALFTIYLPAVIMKT